MVMVILKPEIAKIATIAEERKETSIKRKIGEILSGWDY
jgi:hypothetical protein